MVAFGMVVVQVLKKHDTIIGNINEGHEGVLK